MVIRQMSAMDEDPRLTGEHIRTVDGTNGTVTLVGVVHDHPASKFRARTVVSRRCPDVLALELPPVSLPLFRQYARDERSPPSFGGEMSAAIQAASTDRVVGIDGPSAAFVRQLAGTLSEEDASREVMRTVGEGLLLATKQALACRVAALVASLGSVRIEIDEPAVYDTDWRHDPGAQAADERQYLDRARSVLDVLDPSEAMRIRDSTRETHMAARLDDLRKEGDVVAIVGLDHLERVAKRLDDSRD